MAEDNPNRIQVEIVLDDGSIQKGWAKFNKAAEDSANKSKKTLGEIFNQDVTGQLVEKVKSIPVAVGAAAAAAGVALYGLKKAFDLALDGAKIEAINKQFDILSNQAIGAGNSLKEGLEKSAGGLVDTEDLLKATNKVLVDFQGNASDLPKIFEVARKAAKVSGNDIIQTYEGINKAIASGNTRALKDSGIFLDAAKIQDEYAKSIGKTSKQLSDQEQRQALTNAVLSVGSKQLKDISLSTETLSGAVTRANVQFKELGDTVSIIANKSFGGIFKNIASGIANSLDSFNTGVIANSGSGAEKLAAQIKLLDSEVTRLKENASKGFFLPPEQVAKQKQDLVDLTNQLEKLKSIQDAANDDARKAATIGRDASGKSTSGIPANVQAAIDASDKAAKARIESENKANAEILANQVAADQALLNARIQSAEAQQGFESNFDLQRITQDAFFKEQERINEENQKAALLAIENKYAADKTLLVANKNKEIELINQQAMAREVAAAAAASKAKLAIDEKERTIKLQAVSTFFGGLASLQSSSSKELFEIGKVGAIAQATVNGYLAVTNALANIPAPFNIAAAAGIAIQTASQIAGITSTSFGGGGGAPSVPSGINTSIGSDLNPSELTPSKDRERSPNQGLVVNVNGDILGDESSGKRLVDLMNAAFDANGVSLRQGLV